MTFLLLSSSLFASLNLIAWSILLVLMTWQDCVLAVLFLQPSLLLFSLHNCWRREGGEPTFSWETKVNFTVQWNFNFIKHRSEWMRLHDTVLAVGVSRVLYQDEVPVHSTGIIYSYALNFWTCSSSSFTLLPNTTNSTTTK